MCNTISAENARAWVGSRDNYYIFVVLFCTAEIGRCAFFSFTLGEERVDTLDEFHGCNSCLFAVWAQYRNIKCRARARAPKRSCTHLAIRRAKREAITDRNGTENGQSGQWTTCCYDANDGTDGERAATAADGATAGGCAASASTGQSLSLQRRMIPFN